MMTSFKKQELPDESISDMQDLLKDIINSFLCHLINKVLNSDLFLISINSSSYQHSNLSHVASVMM